MRPRLSILLSPVLCLGLLGGVVAGNRRVGAPEGADPFHARARAAVESIPYFIGDWTGVDEPVPTAAVALLRPNAILSRRYVEHRADDGGRERWASLLVVQCRDTRDMSGHYPPVCYPAVGETLVLNRPFTLAVGSLSVSGREYHFARPGRGLPEKRCVYDFFVVPDRGVVADIRGVREAAADEQQRQFGAAQVQLVMSADWPQAERERIFVALLGDQERVLRALDWTGRP